MPPKRRASDGGEDDVAPPLAKRASKGASTPSASASLKFGSDKSGSVTRLKEVPAELLDVQAPGVRRTPELYTALPPTRDAEGKLHFAGAPDFTPNLTPADVLGAGAFGGYYYRPIASGVTGKVHVDAWKELPAEWFSGKSADWVASHLTATRKDPKVNKFSVDCGLDLREWESSGWIIPQDPFGWFQWYTRYFQGRRSPDDARQIGRWKAVAAEKGRWKNNLIHKCVLAGKAFDDASVSPVVRQTLHHWAYQLTKKDFDAYAALVRKGAKTSFIRS